MPKTKRKKKEEENEREENGIEKSSNWRPAPPDISANAPRKFSPIPTLYSATPCGNSSYEVIYSHPRSKPSTYDSKVKKARAESQAYAYRKIISDGIRLTDEELDVCKWGRNTADYSNVPKRLRGKKSQGGGHDIYRQASALGYIRVVDGYGRRAVG